MGTINERIKCIIDTLFDRNVSAFSRKTGIKLPTIKDIVGGRLNKPGFEVLEKILSADTLNISPDWLILEQGDMLRKSDNPANLDTLQNISIERLFSIIESQQRTIENLSRK